MTAEMEQRLWKRIRKLEAALKYIEIASRSHEIRQKARDALK